MFMYESPKTRKIMKNVWNPGVQDAPWKQTDLEIKGPRRTFVEKIFDDLFDEFEELDKKRFVSRMEKVYKLGDYLIRLDGNIVPNVYTKDIDGKMNVLLEVQVPSIIDSKEELKDRLSMKVKNKNDLLLTIESDNKEEEEDKDKKKENNDGYEKKIDSFDTKIEDDLKLSVMTYKKKTDKTGERVQELNNVKFVDFSKGIMKVSFDVGTSDEIIDIEI